MNETNFRDQHSSASPQRQNRQNVYIVPEDFDKTETSLLPLDHYLTNKDVYSLVQTLFSDSRNWTNWASQNPIDSHYYFSPPYTSDEALLLGYGSIEEDNNLGDNENNA